jgi:protein TonB
MIGTTNRRRWLVCWGISVLLHAALLTLGATLLIKAARFQVRAGKTSTEIDLVIEPASALALHPPVTAPARPSPLRPEEPPAAIPVLAKPVAPPHPQTAVTPPSSPAIPAKAQPSVFPIKPKTVMTRAASNPSTGAVQAQPDELHNEPPEYPEESRAAREEGVVILRVEVTVGGEPTSVSILKSSGYFRLDQAARRAVKQWKFSPAITAGIPVSSEADVPVHFKLQ